MNQIIKIYNGNLKFSRGASQSQGGQMLRHERNPVNILSINCDISMYGHQNCILICTVFYD